MLCVVSPVFHKKFPSPIAVNTALEPLSIVIFDPASTTGNSRTVITISSEASVTHELLAVTEYVVVSVGFTFILAEVSPVLHKKLPVPIAVNVILSPKHITTSSPASTLGA